MTRAQRKPYYYLLEGINAFASSFFFNYLFFLLRDRFQFTSRENLCASALHGLLYVVCSWMGGRIAQRHGYATALRIGLGGMGIFLLAGWLIPILPGQLLALAGWTIFLCLTWPSLEALVSEKEDDAGMARRIGMYNVVWAAAAGGGYFVGGALFEHLGQNSIYLLPLGLLIIQLLVLEWLRRQPVAIEAEPHTAAAAAHHHTPEPAAFRQPIGPERFLKMAWLANPFSYIAINTVLATMPQRASELAFSTTEAGLFCSIWFFVRLAAFLLLWKWTGWHYRFRWLLGAFGALIIGFLALLLASQLWLLVLAQIIFGLATGLIYYSSLFYSMDASEDHGAHGGTHEAAIGAGIFLGPAVGAGALWLAPRQPHAGALAVGVLLLGGLAGLIWLRLRRPAGNPPAAGHS